MTGESHLRDIEVDWVEETPTGKLSKRLPATGIVFRETTTDYENSWRWRAEIYERRRMAWLRCLWQRLAMASR